MLLSDRLLLRQRFIIETINDRLKDISQVEHTRVLDTTGTSFGRKTSHRKGAKFQPSGPVRHHSPADSAANLPAVPITHTR